jgi:pyruvate,water dikinase
MDEAGLIRSGIERLDGIIQGFRLGDNVVWKVESLQDYVAFAEPFVEQAIEDGRRCVYMRFAPHGPILEPRDGLEIIHTDPSEGFDAFSGQVHRIIEERGREVFYVFDNLSALVVKWATDELLANFFQVTCPYLFELDTVAYFALTRGQHAHHAVARIRETTQVLIAVYNVKGRKYVHPLKVWDRYSPQMFLPHLVAEDGWSPVFSSGDAAEVAALASRKPLGIRAGVSAPWESVYHKLAQYREAPRTLPETAPEIAALKQEFVRMMIGGHPEFRRLAEGCFGLDDLFRIRDRLIGSGRIGGKAAGMLLARRILAQYEGEVDFKTLLEDCDDFYVGSDVFFTFLVNNDLFRLRLQLMDDPELSWEEFEEVERRFLAGEFPPEVVAQFRNVLDYYGQAPIIVRSSSLLEDSFGSAFAGKYRSEFCANQGHPDQRLAVFLHAVKRVYASTLNPDVLSYKRKRGLAGRDEQMAILVQRVSGRVFGDFFLPALAGVAMSRNLYVWTNRIDPRQGAIRLVFGLGTRAVDRVGYDYPRMIPVSHPHLRPEVGMKVVKYSQRQLDLIDLRANRFDTRAFREIVESIDYPYLHLLVSEIKEGGLYDPIARCVQAPAGDLVLTFNNLIDRTPFVSLVGEMVAELERVYGHPVEIEFTASIGAEGRVRINLLQCRPMAVPGLSRQVSLPDGVEPERVLFRSSRFIGGGVVDRIRHVVYIPAARYAAIASPDVKKSLGRVVGQVNACLRAIEGRELIMGPGRFGSSNIDLGVNVTYADIENAAVLVEVAREEAGQMPEVSYGTHFFLDLVESETLYLAIYPADGGAEFNKRFFEEAPNVLCDLVPGVKEFEDLVRVIDVCAVTGGKHAQVVADPNSQQAMCFLG